MAAQIIDLRMDVRKRESDWDVHLKNRSCFRHFGDYYG